MRKLAASTTLGLVTFFSVGCGEPLLDASLVKIENILGLEVEVAIRPEPSEPLASCPDALRDRELDRAERDARIAELEARTAEHALRAAQSRRIAAEQEALRQERARRQAAERDAAARRQLQDEQAMKIIGSVFELAFEAAVDELRDD